MKPCPQTKKVQQNVFKVKNCPVWQVTNDIQVVGNAASLWCACGKPGVHDADKVLIHRERKSNILSVDSAEI